MARLNAMRQTAASWLLQGVSPQRLAFTLALGFAIGCFPLFGVTTGLCAIVAIVFRLNLPAIQAANYAAMPLQVVLIWPFVRLGARLIPAGDANLSLHGSPRVLFAHLGGAAAGAVLAWLLCAAPTVAALSCALTPLLRRIPALAARDTANS